MKKSALLMHALTVGVIVVLFMGAAPAQGGEKVVKVTKNMKNAGNGWLGVMLSQSVEVKEEDGAKKKVDSGVEIIDVFEDSAAEKAGLAKGDIIVMIDAEEVKEVGEAVKLIGAKNAGDSVVLIVSRDGSDMKLTAVLGERPEKDTFIYKDLEGMELEKLQELKELGKLKGLKDMEFIWQAGGKPRLGVELIELSDQLRDYFKVEEGRGVLISKVIEDTPANRADLKAGDVILSINRTDVDSVSKIKKALGEIEKDGIAEVEVMRDGRVLMLNATIDSEKPKEGKCYKFKTHDCEKSKEKIIILEDETEEDL
jgi:serine protease Do